MQQEVRTMHITNTFLHIITKCAEMADKVFCAARYM